MMVPGKLIKSHASYLQVNRYDVSVLYILYIHIYNMASRCVSAISDLNPEAKPRAAIEGRRADIADTHRVYVHQCYQQSTALPSFFHV